jgi:hypothetical protein
MPTIDCVAYHLRLLVDDPLNIRVEVVTSLVRSRAQVVTVPFLEKCVFAPPPPDLPPATPLGTSEILGLYGGIADEMQQHVSEWAERCVSDVVTAMVAETANQQVPGERHLVLIFGPPLPKLIGRLASLRLPGSIQVCCLTLSPIPECLGEGLADALALSSSRLWTVLEGVGSWEAESLISSARLPVEMGAAWIHVLEMSDRSRADAVELVCAMKADVSALVPTAKQLPREVVLALDAAHTRANHQSWSPFSSPFSDEMKRVVRAAEDHEGVRTWRWTTQQDRVEGASLTLDIDAHPRVLPNVRKQVDACFETLERQGNVYTLEQKARVVEIASHRPVAAEGGSVLTPEEVDAMAVGPT